MEIRHLDNGAIYLGPSDSDYVRIHLKGGDYFDVFADGVIQMKDDESRFKEFSIFEAAKRS